MKMYKTSKCCNHKAVMDDHQCCYVCMQCLNPCEVEDKEYRYDIFLGGTWERRASCPYKTMIKENFPGLRIFDPEDYDGDDWMANNLRVLSMSKAMFVLVPDFPFPLVGPEVGYYYGQHSTDHNVPLNNLILCWPDEVQPNFVKKNLPRLGQVVDTLEDGINCLKEIFNQ